MAGTSVRPEGQAPQATDPDSAVPLHYLPYFRVLQFSGNVMRCINDNRGWHRGKGGKFAVSVQCHHQWTTKMGYATLREAQNHADHLQLVTTTILL